MKLYAIADLHMPGGMEKPMDVFGAHWEGHVEKIFDDWRQRVGEDDAVLIPGDISWAMYLKDAEPDLQALGALPGRKVLLRGNHDYWWSSVTKIREILPENMALVQHCAVDLGACVVCGTRLWKCPGCGEEMTAEDEKIFRRECMRLEMALQDAVRIARGRPIIVMTHYPPLYASLQETEFTGILEKFPIYYVVYGHLHGKGIEARFEGEHHEIRYKLASCDALGFRLWELALREETIQGRAGSAGSIAL